MYKQYFEQVYVLIISCVNSNLFITIYVKNKGNILILVMKKVWVETNSFDIAKKHCLTVFTFI